MVYGAEAVLPHDLKFRAPRVTGFEEEEALQDDKDTADEARDTALTKSEGYQDKLGIYQSSRLRTRTFNKGDLVVTAQISQKLKILFSDRKSVV